MVRAHIGVRTAGTDVCISIVSRTTFCDLSPGTEVIVDETVLQPGQLSDGGVKNLTALGNVVQWQKVQYDFQYHTSEFECNLVSTVSHTIGV